MFLKIYYHFYFTVFFGKTSFFISSHAWLFWALCWKLCIHYPIKFSQQSYEVDTMISIFTWRKWRWPIVTNWLKEAERCSVPSQMLHETNLGLGPSSLLSYQNQESFCSSPKISQKHWRGGSTPLFLFFSDNIQWPTPSSRLDHGISMFIIWLVNIRIPKYKTAQFFYVPSPSAYWF